MSYRRADGYDFAPYWHVMNVKTSAIVLHLSRVSDHASIAHLYTREHGRMAYYVYGAKRSIQQFMPLTLLTVNAVHLENRNIQQFKDVQVSYISSATQQDICRQTEALFIAEILYRTLVHPMADPVLFDYLVEVIKELDMRQDPENVHLEFLVGFISFLGFGIEPNSTLGIQLQNLKNGENISRLKRQKLLREIIDYYQTHLPDFVPPKSLDVMTEVFA